jgi:methionine-rich copper-binding protein CopC
MQSITKTSALRVLLAALLGASLFPALPAAHSKLIRSSPATDAILETPPAELQLWFSEEPLLLMSAVTLAGPHGAVKLEALRAGGERSLVVRVGTTLEPGAYRLAWKTAGDDGHVIQGIVNFSIKPAK